MPSCPVKMSKVQARQRIVEYSVTDPGGNSLKSSSDFFLADVMTPTHPIAMICRTDVHVCLLIKDRQECLSYSDKGQTGMSVLQVDCHEVHSEAFICMA